MTLHEQQDRIWCHCGEEFSSEQEMIDAGHDNPALARAVVQMYEALGRHQEFLGQYLAEFEGDAEDHEAKDGRTVASSIWCCRRHWLESISDQAHAAMREAERLGEGEG